MPLAKVLDFKTMAVECTSHVMGFAQTIRNIVSYEVIGNILMLYVDSTMRKDILSKDVMKIRNYIHEKSDFTGNVGIDVKKKEIRKASAELEYINKKFKGQIIIKEGN